MAKRQETVIIQNDNSYVDVVTLFGGTVRIWHDGLVEYLKKSKARNARR